MLYQCYYCARFPLLIDDYNTVMKEWWQHMPFVFRICLRSCETLSYKHGTFFGLRESIDLHNNMGWYKTKEKLMRQLLWPRKITNLLVTHIFKNWLGFLRDNTDKKSIFTFMLFVRCKYILFHFIAEQQYLCCLLLSRFFGPFVNEN